MQLLGTGFLAKFKNHIFLVTAKHVIEGCEKRLVMIALGKNVVKLNHMPFYAIDEYDLAIANIDDQLAKSFGISKVTAIPLDDDKSGYVPNGRYFLLGFPGNKNLITPRFPPEGLHVHGTSFVKKHSKIKAKTPVSNAVAFEFDKKTAINTNGARANAPSFKGNSGGPILEVVVISQSQGSKSVGCRFAGVFIGWYNREKEAIAESPSALLELIESIIFHYLKKP